MLLSLSMATMAGNAQSKAKNKKDALRDVVMFGFRDTSSREYIKKVEDAFPRSLENDYRAKK